MARKQVTRKYSPKGSDEVDRLIIESYDDFVRLERRNLLAASSVLILSKFSSIKLSSASVFGLSFENLTPKLFYIGLSSIVLYFFVAFATYGFPGFKTARKSRREMTKSMATITYTPNLLDFGFTYVKSALRYKIWFFLHFYLPLFFGGVALILGIISIA